MPRGDRTGPLGAGARTGRGLGYCSGNSVPGYMVGRGMGRRGGGGGGFRMPGMGGRGRGRMNMFNATGIPGYARNQYPVATGDYDDTEALKQYAESLEQELEAIKARLSETEKNGDKTK